MLELAPGTPLGAYVVTAQIGRGGMSTVYRAHHPALDRDVAIKVLWPALAATPGFLERFRREARAASRLRHPNILTVYDFGTQDGITYMVTELLPGGTLGDRLGRPVPLNEVLRILRGIGAALDAAHAAGLIHRDVKPSNILFTRDGEPVLADFGIARLIEGEQQITAQGTLVGTPHYMAPEMATGGAVGPYSDLYSLGVVTYEMLTGGPPFPRETPLATVRAHIHDTPLPIHEINPAIPPEIEHVVFRAISKRPEERYRSGAALASAFEHALLTSEPPTPRPGSVTAPPDGRPDAPTRVVSAVIPPAYDAVLPGPPRRRRGQVVGAEPRRSRVPLAVLLVLATALIAAATAFVARSTGLDARLGLTSTRPTAAAGTPGAVVTPTAPGTPPPALTPGLGAGSPSPAPGVGTQASPVVTNSPVAAESPSPVAVVLPTDTPLPVPTATATSTAVPATATPDPLRGPLAVQISSPANGERVPARPPIVGRRTGLQEPDQHLWLLIHPEGGPDNWWPYKSELIAGRDGTFRIEDVEIGGPSGSRHVLAIGVVDGAGHRAMLEQIRARTDQPFVGGQPPGFRELTRVTVVKR